MKSYEADFGAISAAVGAAILAHVQHFAESVLARGSFLNGRIKEAEDRALPNRDRIEAPALELYRCKTIKELLHPAGMPAQAKQTSKAMYDFCVPVAGDAAKIATHESTDTE